LTIQECRCIRDKDLLRIIGELCPGPGAKCHSLNELLGSTGVVAGGNLLNQLTDFATDILKHWRHRRVISKQGKKRRLEDNEPAKQF
jgi:hypothetical protein